MLYLVLALSNPVITAPPAAVSPLEAGFAGALRGCEEWVLNPSSWVDGTEPFRNKVALGETMGLVKSIPDVAQPPSQMRRANHYWRINSTSQSGYFLVVSDQLPICHITGGGSDDFQPIVSQVLASSEFSGRWTLVEERVTEDLVTSRYRLQRKSNFEIVISRAAAPGGRTDRVQVLATASLNLSK